MRDDADARRRSVDGPAVERLGLFRTARASRVLEGFGVFREQHPFDARARDEERGDFLARPGAYGAVETRRPRDDDDETRAARFYEREREADAFFARSERSAGADAFISHAWLDPPALKHLALLLYANLFRAVAAAWAAWALVALVLVASRHRDVAALGGAPWLPVVFLVVPATVFFATFFVGHVAAETFRRPQRWWLDKLCIHQRRDFLKYAGIRALPHFVRSSARLCVLHSEGYFSRLWTSFEVATFLAEHSADRVDVVPLWLAPWVLAVVAIDMFASVAASLLLNAVGNMFIEPFGLAAGALLACTLVASVAYVPMALPVVVAYRARRRAQEMMLEQLDGFSLRQTECSVEADRRYVERHISSIYGGPKPIEAFEKAVRTDVRRLLVERGGDDRTPLLLAAIPFMPLAWICPTTILGCDGLPCAEDMVLYGYDDVRVFVAAQCLCWGAVLLEALSVYPAIERLLRRTERIRSPSARLLASGGAVAAGYAAWGFASGITVPIIYVCMAAPGALSAAAVASLFAGLTGWTVYLFR